ncbi:Uncharacterised protein [Serratia quinivorans]|nr:Uncharacterised protein [Serratia quinivorans]
MQAGVKITLWRIGRWHFPFDSGGQPSPQALTGRWWLNITVIKSVRTGRWL